MLRSFTVKNFRGFSELTVEPLARVNLIAGMNNTGKTALLEAVQLLCNPTNCKLPVDVNEVRGLTEPSRAFVELSEWLFHDKNLAHPAELSAINGNGHSHTLAIQLLDASAAREQFQQMSNRHSQGIPSTVFDHASTILFLHYTGPRGVERVSVGGVERMGGFFSASPAVPWHVPTTFLAPTRIGSPDDVRQFSELDVANRQQEVVSSLKMLDERLKRLALVLLGDRPVIHGDVGLSRLVPLALMGEGVRRLLSFLLAIANSRTGVVLIDEIENGLHYSVMQKIWQAVANSARQADVQIFATTHSYECIQAAHRAFRENGPYDLRLFRLDRSGSELKVARYDQTSLETSIDMSLEVR
jgi:hypothetical protein